MKKLSKIEFVENNQIICFFESGEVRLLDLSSVRDKYIDKILGDKKILMSAKIGVFGELYWDKMAEIRELNGNITPCEYDLSPEFIYANSQAVSSKI